jgi:23S rRNA (uracil1939-C5)-methyltransferase
MPNKTDLGSHGKEEPPFHWINGQSDPKAAMPHPCPMLHSCPGCQNPWSPHYAKHVLGKTSDWRNHAKLAGLSLPGEGVTVHAPNPFHQRTIISATLSREAGRNAVGFSSSNPRSIVDLPGCPLLSVELNGFWQHMRSLWPNIQYGPFKLRQFKGSFGVWLDWPRRVLDYFLKEERLLRRILEVATVEIGQKYATVLPGPRGLITTDDLTGCWQSTIDQKGEEKPLFSAIGSFSQPGPGYNQRLLETLRAHLTAIHAKGHWLELGAGCGNLTLPLSEYASRVTALEWDPVAFAALQKNLDYHHLTQVKALRFNFKANQMRDLSQPSSPLGPDTEGWLADPPRSGLGEPLLQTLKERLTLKHLITIYCHPHSFFREGILLQTAGWRLSRVTLIDQFPFSSFIETVASWTR